MWGREYNFRGIHFTGLGGHLLFTLSYGTPLSPPASPWVAPFSSSHIELKESKRVWHSFPWHPSAFFKRRKSYRSLLAISC